MGEKNSHGEAVKRCPDCGKALGFKWTKEYCGKCTFKHGEIWILNMQNWAWRKEVRGD